jgi:prophage DNA circulation protein
MALTQEALNALDEIRVVAQDLLDTQKLSASRVVTVRRNTRPVRLLSFDYYGNSDEAQTLIDINSNINASYFEGDIEVLTE